MRVIFRDRVSQTFLMEIVMGQVIPWPKPENLPVRPVTDFGGSSGQVLLFLGVRYERHDEAAKASSSRSPEPLRPQPRRKRG